MPANRLYLHIGTHKTGTTSFQGSLSKNRRRLAKQGYFAVPAPERGSRRFWQGPEYNNTRLAQAMLRAGVATVPRLAREKYGFSQKVLDRVSTAVLEAMAGRPEPNLILSAEAFTFLRTPEEAERVRAFLDATGREVVVVVAWRSDADWAASWHNHIQKKPANDARNRALPDAQRADGAWYFDKPAIRAFWSVFGPLHEVDYDAALRAEGNVIPALYRAIDVDPTGFKVDIKRNLRMVADEGEA